MKKYVCRFVICIFAMIPLIGCDDVEYPIWDFPPSNVGITVRNHILAGGNSLLDPNFENNILDNDISITYNGEVYPLNDPGNGTRFIPARWHGLRIGLFYGYDGDDGTTALLFGEFQTEKHEKSHPETFTINWGDGTSDEITFDLYVTYRDKGKKSTVHRSVRLNGELKSDKVLMVES